MLAHVVRKGFQLKFQVRMEGLLLAAAYAVSCWAVRQITVDQFYLAAGVRVSALLLFPTRLWPYLILGEYAYLAHSIYPMVERYGIAWAVLRSVLLMPVAALIVRLHMKYITKTSIGWLVSLAAVTGISLTLINVLMAQLLWPTPPSIPAIERMVRYSLGDFVGIMTIAPLAVLWIRRSHTGEWRIPHLGGTVASVLAILGLGIAAHLVRREHASFETTLQLSMALPAIALTCLHGWRGAALAVPLLSLVIGFTMPSTGKPWSFDSETFAIQQMLAVTGSALLILGSSITHYFHHYSAGTSENKRVIALTKESNKTGEQALRERALDINRIGEGIDFQLSETADWLKRHGHEAIAFSLIRTSVFYSRKFRAQASLVYPTALEHVGLYLALQVGGISEMWDSTERMLRPRLIGDPCRLSVALQLSAYRTLTDAVSLLLQQEKGKIRVNARCGEVRGRRGMLVVVEVAEACYQISESTNAKAIEMLTGRTLTYGGTIQCRRNRIRILLLDN